MDRFDQLKIDDTDYITRHSVKFQGRKRHVAKDPKKIVAYIPGIVREIHVKVGQNVRWGERLLVLEAMKMRNDITAPVNGIVKDIHVQTGVMVQKNQVLVELE